MLDFSGAPEFGRASGLKTALNLLFEKKVSNPFIIETGTSRGNLGGGVEGDGQATPLFGWYCKKHDGSVWTIDIEKEAINQCKEITKDYADVTKYYVDNSVDVIKSVDKKIDLLYLDSANDPKITMSELEAAMPNVTPETIIYIDDTSYTKKRPGGVCKGVIAYKYLRENGWSTFYDDGNQVIMIHNGKKLGLIDKIILNLKYRYIYSRVIRRNAL